MRETETSGGREPRRRALRWTAVAIAAVVGWSSAAAAPTGEPASACRADETVLFACPSRGKRIAVCASRGWTPDAGTIAYRFGVAGWPERVVPARPMPPRDAVRVGVLDFSGGGADYASFADGDRVHTVYSAVSGRWGLRSGFVTADRAGRRIASWRCDRGHEGEFPSGFTTGSGLPAADAGFTLPP